MTQIKDLLVYSTFLLIITMISCSKGDTFINDDTFINGDVIFKDAFSKKDLNENWEILSGNWNIENGELKGAGYHDGWAVLKLDMVLPDNKSVKYRTKIRSGQLSELMLNLDEEKYVRIYIYTIDQSAVLGNGGKSRIPIGGGPSIITKNIEVKQGEWYEISASSQNSEFTLMINGSELIKYKDNKNHLNKKGTIGFISNGIILFDDVEIVEIIKL